MRIVDSQPGTERRYSKRHWEDGLTALGFLSFKDTMGIYSAATLDTAQLLRATIDDLDEDLQYDNRGLKSAIRMTDQRQAGRARPALE